MKLLLCIWCIHNGAGDVDRRSHYSPGPATLYFGTRPLGVKQMEVVIDSGSSYTYFGYQPYQALVSAVNLRRSIEHTHTIHDTRIHIYTYTHFTV